MVRLNRPAYSLGGPGPKAGLWFMGQFSLDSSDIISGFDGILKTHSLDFLGFFFFTILIQRQISGVEVYCTYILKCLEIKETELYWMDDCTLIYILAKSRFEGIGPSRSRLKSEISLVQRWAN